MACPGAVAEWLGRGLQSLVQRFESARRLSTVRVSSRTLRGLAAMGGTWNPESKCRDMNFWMYLALAVGVLVLFNVLLIVLVAILNRSSPESD